MSTKSKTVARSAVTGQFITIAKAKANPNTTIIQKIKPRKNKQLIVQQLRLLFCLVKPFIFRLQAELAQKEKRKGGLNPRFVLRGTFPLIINGFVYLTPQG